MRATTARELAYNAVYSREFRGLDGPRIGLSPELRLQVCGNHFLMPRSMARIAPLGFVILLIALWQFGASRESTQIVPGPWAVLKGILSWPKRVAAQVRRGFFVPGYLGFSFRGGLAIPFGLFLGWRRRSAMAFNPMIQVLRPISPLAWIPIAILWFGVGDLSAIFLIFVASFLPLTVSAMNAVRSIDPVHINAGLISDFPGPKSCTVSYTQPYATTYCGLRISLGVSWLVVVAAEMIAVNSGLGFLIVDARNAGNRYDLVSPQ